MRKYKNNNLVLESIRDLFSLKKENEEIKDRIIRDIRTLFESLIRKIDGCANNPESSSATKIGRHNLCAYSMSTIWAFDNIEHKHTLYL